MPFLESFVCKLEQPRERQTKKDRPARFLAVLRGQTAQFTPLFSRGDHHLHRHLHHHPHHRPRPAPAAHPAPVHGADRAAAARRCSRGTARPEGPGSRPAVPGRF